MFPTIAGPVGNRTAFCQRLRMTDEVLPSEKVSNVTKNLTKYFRTAE